MYGKSLLYGCEHICTFHHFYPTSTYPTSLSPTSLSPTSLPKMTTLLRLQPRLQAPASILSFCQKAFNLPSRRTHTHDSSKSEGEGRSPQRDSGGTEGSPNHPMPSNKAHPTLQDGKDSPVADFEGNLREDLPKDVTEHNEEVEHRNDRPYNNVTDEQGV